MFNLILIAKCLLCGIAGIAGILLGGYIGYLIEMWNVDVHIHSNPNIVGHILIYLSLAPAGIIAGSLIGALSVTYICYLWALR